METSSELLCILCLENLEKPNDRNYVDGKTNVRNEPDDLPFVVSNASKYICKKCLSLLRKRRNWKDKILEMDYDLSVTYRRKAASFGISFKLKHPSKRLQFRTENESDRSGPRPNPGERETSCIGNETFLSIFAPTGNAVSFKKPVVTSTPVKPNIIQRHNLSIENPFSSPSSGPDHPTRIDSSTFVELDS